MAVLKSPPLSQEVPAMTKPEATAAVALSKAVLLADPDFLKEIVRATVQEMLEAEMTDALGAAKGERTEARRGYRSGSCPRTLVTRVGKLELRVPQDRAGRFSTELFARYQRSEQALVSSLAEMYVQGVSTRKVKAITEELCGHAFSASAISEINKTLDDRLAAFAARRLEEAFPYLILDARYERVREGGVVRSQAHIAIGVDWEGRRQILAVEISGRESRSSRGDFLRGLIARGLHGVELVVADDHAGLRAAIRETLPEAAYQRCYVHFLRNALDHLPRKADDDCLQELRWLYDRRDLAEARADLAARLTKWEARYPRLTAWAEEAIEETLTFYHLPRRHHKHLKSTNMLERLNEEIKRRTHVVRIFPNAESLRKPSALAPAPPSPRSPTPRTPPRAIARGRSSHQRTTPSRQGSGPASTTRANAARCSAVHVAALPGALRSISPDGPSALNRSTQSRTICSPTPPTRTASVRVRPSAITASASSRRTCFACRLSRASRRRSLPLRSARSSIAAAMENRGGQLPPARPCRPDPRARPRQRVGHAAATTQAQGQAAEIPQRSCRSLIPGPSPDLARIRPA